MMAQTTLTRVIQPSQQGFIVIPDEIREALGVTDSTRLLVRLVDDHIIISKVKEPTGPGESADSSVRIYTDEEIAEFFEEDKIPPELAEWARQQVPPRLRWISDPEGPGLP
jgi:bifunctional DNA-binding transcriptional regulator/antitoxin component of YhaV-PrlF toxin-antitoxin module